MTYSQSLRALKTSQGTGIVKGDGFSVDPRLLVIKPGFNNRDAFLGEEYYEQPEVKNHIRRLADSYIAGRFVPPIAVQVVDNEVIVRSGHCRTRALRLAIADGAEIKAIQVVEHKGDELAQEILNVTGNDGLPVTPLSLGVSYDRMIKFGHTEAEIAEKVGRTEEHVKQCLALVSLPLEIKKLIQMGKIASTYAAELFAQYGAAGALEIIQNGIQQLEQTTKPGKKVKLTKSKVNNGPRMTRKAFEQLHAGFSTIAANLDACKISEGKVTMELTMEQYDKLRVLQMELNGEILDKAPDDENLDTFCESQMHSEHEQPGEQAPSTLFPDV